MVYHQTPHRHREDKGAVVLVKILPNGFENNDGSVEPFDLEKDMPKSKMMIDFVERQKAKLSHNKDEERKENLKSN